MEKWALSAGDQKGINSTVAAFTRLIKTWEAWQSDGYVLDKDYQELGNMLYTGKAILVEEKEGQGIKELCAINAFEE